jgi:alkylation response protein AidB-like acyl-CoA dehydrogenase
VIQATIFRYDREKGGRVELTHSREQLALRAAVHEFLARAQRGRPVDGSCDVETWKGLAGLGLTGITIPLTAGGSGGTAVELAVIAEQLGATLAHVPFLESAGFCGALLTAAADSEPAAALLPELASGSTIATFAILEADGAWSTDSITTTARQENGGWRLAGARIASLIGVDGAPSRASG